MEHFSTALIENVSGEKLIQIKLQIIIKNATHDNCEAIHCNILQMTVCHLILLCTVGAVKARGKRCRLHFKQHEGPIMFVKQNLNAEIKLINCSRVWNLTKGKVWGEDEKKFPYLLFIWASHCKTLQTNSFQIPVRLNNSKTEFDEAYREYFGL